MELLCPNCETRFDYHRNSTPGIPDVHNEHLCPNCGQVLIWDYPKVHDAPGGQNSEPRECGHGQLKNSGAMVPTLLKPN
jgi:hypothetical protein